MSELANALRDAANSRKDRWKYALVECDHAIAAAHALDHIAAARAKWASGEWGTLQAMDAIGTALGAIPDTRPAECKGEAK